MTGWDVLDRLIGSFPPIAMTLLLISALAAVVIFIVGFSKHGSGFLKYGFKQVALSSSLEKRFDSMEAKFDERFSRIDDRFSKIDERFSRIDDRLSRLDTRITAIETNHFGHLKNYLGILNGVLLDRDIIDNQTKARLDNELRGM